MSDLSKYCKYCLSVLNEDGTCPKCADQPQPKQDCSLLLPGTGIGKVKNYEEGRYIVGKCVGRGGFGTTYIGRDLKLDTLVAIKEYFPKKMAKRDATETSVISVDPDQQKAYDKYKGEFLFEARTLAKFKDEPGIVSVNDILDEGENNTAYIIMEYLQGIDLKQFLKQNGPMDPDTLLSWMLPVMYSLHVVHTPHGDAKGYVHKDISPDNIMIQDESVKLLDFGAAKEIGVNDGKLIYKKGYAPPEQYSADGNQGPWTDVYAMCATMYKCLTQITPPESREREKEDTLKPPSQAISNLPYPVGPHYEAVLMKGMSLKIEDRYKSMKELAEAFLEAREEDMPAAPAPQDTFISPREAGYSTQYYPDGENSQPRSYSDSYRSDPEFLRKQKIYRNIHLGYTIFAVLISLFLLTVGLATFTGNVANKKAEEYPEAKSWVTYTPFLKLYENEKFGAAFDYVVTEWQAFSDDLVYSFTGKSVTDVHYIYMPDVVGENYIVAEAMLRNAGFKVVTCGTTSNTVAADRVMSTTRTVGAGYQIGTEVIVYYSLGPDK